ncbi:hypothetical protein E2C06_20255 [Dankookia rubra]|uniref:Uncharacterized protein n=1 Tax=Dankookia rubra TaxID=1442381 RepID=A0A4R5QCG3_9PROT|nr:hypothetical protein [Dankookia rubra]TDH60830.1 hypothetical protein E2C06_20255 [Dankookia rubra]
MDDGWVGSLDDKRAVARVARQPTPWDEVNTTRKQARAALERDFRARIASGEVVLTGLQIAPTAAYTRSKIPPIWAPRLRFLTTKNVVFMGNIKFVDVLASHFVRTTIPLPAEAEAEGAPANTPDPPKKPPGRPSYKRAIEEDLRTHWADVRRRAAKEANGKPNWSELARVMRRRLIKANNNHHDGIPEEPTLRKHLPRIYKQLLRENPALN